MRFAKLKVKQIVKETPDCVSVEFEVPEELKEKFSYKPGQYLTFKQDINGEELRRSYSICSAPYEGQLKVAIKRVEGGRFSTFANTDLKIGEELESMKPMGRFCAKTENEDANYLMFAAGSGITPVISIIKDILHNKPESDVTLIYGNKSFDSIIFREELEGLKNQFMGRFRLIHILSREVMGEDIYQGRIDEEKCKNLTNKLIDLSQYNEAFICGPETMILSVKDFLMKNNFEKDHIRFELFTTPGQQKEPEKIVAKEIKPEEGKAVAVIIDGYTHHFKLAEDGVNILDAANAHGADLPFACKGGVCATCRAKLVEGEVNMDVNYSLEEDEVERGFILTCQSHPKTEKVIVDFDTV